MKRSRHGHKYNWKPSLPDFRDEGANLETKPLPPVIDLHPQMPAVYDQGQLSSCTGNAIAAAFEYEMLKQKESDFVPSRMFIYLNERIMENDVADDNGAIIRDGIKSVVKIGVCPETMWPYVPAKFAERPPQACYTEAAKHKAMKYMRVTQSVEAIMQALANGYPVVFGFSVYESFEGQQVAHTGVLNMPKQNEKDMGGHAVLLTGYHMPEKRFIVRNSWGPNWGVKGYFTMPFEYVASPDLASDFWMIQVVS